MSVVVGESPTKFMPFHLIPPKALTLTANRDDFAIKFLLCIVMIVK
jgi:hypothetical protein